MTSDSQSRFTYEDKISVHLGAGGAHTAVSRRISEPEIAPYYEKAMQRILDCPYCSGRLIHPDKNWHKPYPANYPYDIEIRECPSCTWWDMSFQFHTLGTEDYERWDFHEAIIKSFNLCAYETPFNILRSHLERNFEDIRHIHHRRFEELCGSIFREHMNCEIEHTAASRDGGVDLYAIKTNSEVWAIECKRREGPITETVKEVRAFLGAMIGADVPRGIFVSTADHFSSPALALANSPNLNKKGLELHLKDYGQFKELFQANTQTTARPWVDLLPDYETLKKHYSQYIISTEEVFNREEASIQLLNKKLHENLIENLKRVPRQH